MITLDLQSPSTAIMYSWELLAIMIMADVQVRYMCSSVQAQVGRRKLNYSLPMERLKIGSDGQSLSPATTLLWELG